MTDTTKPKQKPSGSKSARKATKAGAPPRTGFMTLLARFIAGFALAPTLLLAAAIGNAWGNTQYVISPAVNDLIEDFGGYALGAAMFCFAVVSIFLMAGRWRWIAPSQAIATPCSVTISRPASRRFCNGSQEAADARAFP